MTGRLHPSNTWFIAGESFFIAFSVYADVRLKKWYKGVYTMKNERIDLHRLLGGLLLFCVISALFYVEREKKEVTLGTDIAIDAMQSQTQKNGDLQVPISAEVSTERLLSEISAVVAARDVKGLARVLKGLPIAKARAVVTALIQDETVELLPQEKLHLLLALAMDYMRDSGHQELLQLLIEHASIFNTFSPVYYAATHGYAALIPHIVAWAEQQKEKQKISEDIAQAVYVGLRKSIEDNNVTAFKTIVAQKVTITPDQATQLLWLVVDQVKNPAFVPLLIEIGADSNSVRNGYSLLAHAVTTKSLPMVKAVNEANPHTINTMHDSEVGTPLQLAIQLGLANIDEYLRSQGARE